MAFLGWTALTEQPVFHTTFIVPIESRDEQGNLEPVTHHTHFSVGKKRDSNDLRSIAYETHPVHGCRNPNAFVGDLVHESEFPTMTIIGLPIDQVSDWSEKEAELLSSALCPETPERHARVQARMAQLEARWNELDMRGNSGGNFAQIDRHTRDEWNAWQDHTWASEEENEEESEEASDEEDMDFPDEFEDEDSCPVCKEDEYPAEKCLLRLACGHTLCKGCLKGVKGKCPKCRKEIDKSLIKKKQVKEKK